MVKFSRLLIFSQDLFLSWWGPNSSPWLVWLWGHEKNKTLPVSDRFTIVNVTHTHTAINFQPPFFFDSIIWIYVLDTLQIIGAQFKLCTNRSDFNCKLEIAAFWTHEYFWWHIYIQSALSWAMAIQLSCVQDIVNKNNINQGEWLEARQSCPKKLIKNAF